MQICSGAVARYHHQQTKDVFTIESHVLRLGDIALATNPFELFLNYGNQIRARSLAKQTFLIQLACGSWGYLPTEKAKNAAITTPLFQAVLQDALAARYSFARR